MSLALGAGAGIVDACTLANVAAGIVVGKTGTAIATMSEIKSSLRPFDASMDATILTNCSRWTPWCN